MSKRKRTQVSAAEARKSKQQSERAKARNAFEKAQKAVIRRAENRTKIGSGRRTITFLFERDNGRCFWCGFRLRLEDCGDQSNPKMPTKDHILPRVHGGTGNVNNLVLSCQDCNCKKGDRPINPRTGWRVNHEILSVLIKE